MTSKITALILVSAISATHCLASPPYKVDQQAAELSAIKALARFGCKSEKFSTVEAILHAEDNFWDIALKDKSNNFVYFCSVNAKSGRTYYITSTKKALRLKDLKRKTATPLTKDSARQLLERCFSRIDQPYHMRLDVFTFTKDKTVGENFILGKTQGIWNAYFKGYKFVDRKVSISITLDALDGDLLGYLENLSAPATSEPSVRVSESEARSKIQPRLGTEGARKATATLGWYVPKGEARARLGYAFFTPGKLPRRIIDAHDGALTEINMAVK